MNMNKEDLLQELAIKVNLGEISREEVTARLQSVRPTSGNGVDSEGSHFNVTKMLYVLGGAIVIVGIGIFIARIWTDIGSLGRIAVTLGLGLTLALIGSLLFKKEKGGDIGSVFHFLGGFLISGGATVALSEFNIKNDWAFVATSATTFLFYMLLSGFHKRAILTFFAIANATSTIYLILNAIIGGPFRGTFQIEDIYKYTTILIGISYILLAYAFKTGWSSKLIGALYFFGSIFFLSPAFTNIFDSMFWQFIYLIFLSVGFSASVYIRSRIVLIFSTIFLLAYISYITSEYFADSIGWPISLVILGLSFIGLGYASI
ncbi:MAG TPA: DUF2157 domain-containing protein, partial [Candidatus Paceibacterota bacterium]